MKTEVKNPNSYTRELTIEVQWEELADDFEAAIKKFGRKIRLPGFRPGKVPRKVLVKNFQPNIEADFIEDSFQKFYLKALNEKNLVPINKARIDDVHFHYGEHFSFKAVFEIEPEIQLPQLKRNSLKTRKTVFLTDEEDVELAIDEICHSRAVVKLVEDGAKEGHFIFADLQKVDFSGVPIIGEKFEKRYLKIGEGIFGGDNHQKLLGLKPGDKAQVIIPEGENGNQVPYEVSVIKVEEEILPELNMDFIKQMDPSATSISAWRESIKERVNRTYEQRARERFERQLSDTLIDLVNVEYPPSLLETYLERILEDVKQSNSGSEIDDQQLKATYKSVAERNLNWYLIRKALIKEQNFEVSKEEIDREIQRLIERSPEHTKEIQKYYRKPSNRDRIEDDLMEKKILDYLHDFARIKEVKVHTRDLRQNPSQEV